MKKKNIKIYIIIAIILFSLILGGLYYLNNVYLPPKIKKIIIEKITEEYNLNAKLKKVSVGLLKGIVLEDFIIFDSQNNSAIITIDNLSARVIMVPFVKRKIIFPSISIKGASVNLIREEDGKLNVQKLFSNEQGDQKLPSLIPIHNLKLKDIDISFQDNTLEPKLLYKARLANSNVKILPSGIRFSIEGNIQNDDKSTTIHSNGEYRFGTKELKISSNLSNINLLMYQPYLNIPFKSNVLFINDIKSEFSLKDNILYLSANAKFKNSDILLQDFSMININSDGKLTLNIALKETQEIDYLLELNNFEADIKNNKNLPTAKIENATIKVLPQKIELENIKLSALDSTIFAKGTLANFTNKLKYDFDAETTIQLPKLMMILQDYSDLNLENIQTKGTADIKANISNTTNINEISIDGYVALKNSSIQIPDFPLDFDEINGSIHFTNDVLDWTDISLRVFDEKLKSKATINNLKSPNIKLSLHNNDIDISSSFSVNIDGENKFFDLNQLKGKFYDSDISLQAKLNIYDENNYQLSLNTDSTIELNDYKEIKQANNNILTEINPKGKLNLSGFLKGNIKDVNSITARFQANSKELTIYNMKFQDIQLKIAQELSQIKIPQLLSKFYDGAIVANGLIDTEKENDPFAFKLAAQKVDLAKLFIDLPMEKQDFAGIMTGTVVCSGTLGSLEKIEAKSEIHIEDGKLWEFNPLKGLGEFLFIPRYDTLIFKEARGNFNIANKKIFTDNLIMKANILALAWEGYMDFDGNLNFTITPKTLENLSDDPGEFEEFIGGIFSEIGGLTVVELTGTVKDPKFGKKTIVGDFLKKIKDLFD